VQECAQIGEELQARRARCQLSDVAELLHARWTTACRPTRRHWKEASMRIAMSQFDYINRKAQRYLKQGEPGFQ